MIRAHPYNHGLPVRVCRALGAARSVHAVSLDDVRVELGVTVRLLVAIERGLRCPTPGLAIGMADAYQLDEDDRAQLLEAAWARRNDQVRNRARWRRRTRGGLEQIRDAGTVNLDVAESA